MRPEEIDNLKKPVQPTKTTKPNWRIEYSANEVPILWVFQPKLSVEEKKAWKPIPLFLPEQIVCIQIINEDNFQRPLNKTLRKVFPEKRITGYSGRKAFVDLMMSFKQELEEISIWMGHSTISTTWRHYKQKQIVRYKKVA